MDIVGLDLHKRESQLASKAPDGTITDRRIVTSRDRLTAVFGDRPRALFARCRSKRGGGVIGIILNERDSQMLQNAILDSCLNRLVSDCGDLFQ